MTLTIPHGPRGEAPQFERIVRSLIDADQFDDWLPDPLFYLDRSSGLQLTVDRLTEIWRSREIALEGVVPLALPRASGRSVPALALPFDLRCVTYAVIAGLAGDIEDKLIRDKVLGFQFRPTGHPLFTQPGEEMQALAGLVVNAAVVHGARQVTMVDVVDFSVSSSPPNLSKVLTSAGVDNAQAQFVERLLKSGSSGLPSVDDAFAYLYNYYLKPVDDALAAQGINFFRYRDEYFVLSEDSANAVLSALGSLGLRGITTDFNTRMEELEDILVEDASNNINPEEPDESIPAREVLARLGDGELVAMCSVSPQELNKCQSDSFLVDFELDEGEIVEQVFADAMAGKILDSIDLAPVLRSYNRVRALAVPFVAPFEATPGEHRDLSAQLTQRQAALRNALSAGLDSGRAFWQVQWAAALLAEADSLEPASAQLMMTALGRDLPPEIGWQLRVGLARQVKPDPNAIWKVPGPDASPHVQRASALTAFYLARWNIEGPWNALKADGVFGDTILRNWLVANL